MHLMLTFSTLANLDPDTYTDWTITIRTIKDLQQLGGEICKTKFSIWMKNSINGICSLWFMLTHSIEDFNNKNSAVFVTALY